MALSPKPNTTRYEIRSISLPSRPHPNILRIEAELIKKLKTWETWSILPQEHTENLFSLVVSYKCVEELLNLPMTQHAFSLYQHDQKWVDGLLDGSVRVLDICGITKDMVSQMKEHVRDLQCALRRRKGDSSIENSIGKFISFRKKIKKEAKGIVAGLKQVDDIIGGSPVADLDHHHHLVVVIKVLLEVSRITVFALESLFVFFSIKAKPSRWSLVLKMMHKGRVACEDQQLGDVNELENLDAALLNVCKDGSSNHGEKIQIAQNRLEAMEAYTESIENGLDCLFRHLIRTRVLLLHNMSL